QQFVKRSFSHRIRTILPTALRAALVLALVPSIAASQGVVIGRVDDVRGTEARESCFASKSTSPDPRALTRFRSGTVGQPWPRDSVIRVNDRIVLTRQTDARVGVDSSLARGTVYLAPDIGR